jgi:8-oxo-dGTP pyrophosphatase MutT (NUDIX family)
MLDHLLSANDIYEETGIPARTVRDMWARGELPYVLPHYRQRGRRPKSQLSPLGSMSASRSH